MKLDEWLDGLEETHGKISSDPWMYSDILDNDGGGVVNAANQIIVGSTRNPNPTYRAICESIASSRNALPVLVEMVRRILTVANDKRTYCGPPSDIPSIMRFNGAEQMSSAMGDELQRILDESEKK